MKKLVGTIPLLGIALVFAVNLGTVGVPLPKEAGDVARLFGLDQKWTLFAPHPPRETPWLVIPATLADGSEVDLFTGGPVTYEKPDLAEHRFSNQRWGRLLGKLLREPALAPYKERFASYLCASWDAEHPENQARSLSIYVMRERVPAPGEAPSAPSLPEKKHESLCATSQAQ
jgi:hypothetical protein